MKNILLAIQEMFRKMRADAELIVAWLKQMLFPNTVEEHAPRFVINVQIIDLDIATEEQLVHAVEELILDIKHQGLVK